MASSKKVLLLATVAAVASLASLASATEWLVGDERGWRSKFNETGWANDKTFVVGDSLRFRYNKEKHTVIKVGKHAFEACDLSANRQLRNWTSGDDVVPLDKPGKWRFICNKPKSCLHGMKLAIDVVDPSPAPSPLPFPFPGTAPAPSPVFLWPAPARPARPALAPPASPPASSPPSAAVSNPVGGAVAAAAAAVVVAALAF